MNQDIARQRQIDVVDSVTLRLAKVAAVALTFKALFEKLEATDDGEELWGGLVHVADGMNVEIEAARDQIMRFAEEVHGTSPVAGGAR